MFPQYLAPIIREQMPFIETHRKPHFRITPKIREKLLKISPAQIDRYLKQDKAALRRRIPVRTHYSDSERKTPGFMQIDTVHHCNDSGSGEFALTLSAADVASGWIELFDLPNKAHKWALEALQTLHNSLSFPLIELHSDNGSEFIRKWV